VVVLGAQGGVVSDDLSAYLVAARGREDYVCLDGGSVATGLARAVERGSFPAEARPAELLRERVRGYLVSHPHLDHVAGMALALPGDAPGKFLGGLPATLDALQQHLFGGPLWANFLTEGPGALGQLRALRLAPRVATPLPRTDLTVEAWPLAHAGGESTAFLLQRPGGAALLYLGDTGPDAVEGSSRLLELWRRVAPLVRARALRGVFVEVSYPDPRPDPLLFGHLTPTWLHRELTRLADEVGGERPLAGLVVAVTHIKPASDGSDAAAQVRRQLGALPDLGVRFVYPAQGRALEL
jgi:3',5'-cyclic-nucleotide phosphodiesterase